MACQFPAADLVRMRRQVAAQADESNDPEFVTNAMRFVMGVDSLRLEHEELTGCPCWYAALKEAK